MKISKRNQFYVNLAIKDLDFWDIACDHGQAGYCAFLSKKFNNIYFVDPVENILNQTEKNIRQIIDLDAQSRLHFYCLPGQDIHHKVEGNLLLAGVGGELSKQILLSLLSRDFLKVERIILSPYTDLKKIGVLEADHHFQLHYQKVQETSFCENKRERAIFIYDRKK